MINELNIFNGPFKDILPKFINYQRAQGYDYGASIIYRYKLYSISYVIVVLLVYSIKINTRSIII